MADVPWAGQRQLVEHRPVPVRVRAAAKPLGAGGHGPVHPTDRRLRHPCRSRGWQRTVPHVQPRDSRAVESEAPQLRQRPAVPVPPMARQPADTAGDRGQECAVGAAVASVCRTADRHTATRMRRSDAVLVGAGPGTEAVCIPGLLQRASGPCCFRRTDASPGTEGCRNAPPLPMGSALPRSLSDADCGVTSDQRRRWPACRRARVRSPSQQGRASAALPTQAIARTSRMTPAPGT